VIRYLFFPSSSAGSSGGQRGRDAAATSRAREAAVERIQQMFPQLDRRTILWELQRNGGNMTTTTERILAGRIETVCIMAIPFSRYPPSFYNVYLCFFTKTQISRLASTNIPALTTTVNFSKPVIHVANSSQGPISTHRARPDNPVQTTRQAQQQSKLGVRVRVHGVRK
jgi:hypothetical protein